jgi:putative ABC transport system permease protein
MRSLPGVVAASALFGIPMSGGGAQSNYGLVPDPDKANIVANYYEMDEQGVAALGVKLLSGRVFTEQEVQFNPNRNHSDFVPSVIVTQDLGKAFFGDESPLGKTIYDGYGRQSAQVVGVIDNMIGSWVDFDDPSRVIFVPRISSGPVARYAVRAEPGRRDALIAEIERKLAAEDISRAITSVRPHTYFVKNSYRADTRMVAYLSVIAALMVAITALGIVGLASFHVSVRTKQIGTRRAVGARKVDIIRYFMLENWLLTTGGVIAGAIMAFAFGHWLSAAYALPRLQPLYVAAGIVLLWILGQLAVFVPARRAAAIPPAIATRTV